MNTRAKTCPQLDPEAGLHSHKTSGRDNQPDTYSDPGALARPDSGDLIEDLIDLTPVRSEDERYELVVDEEGTTRPTVVRSRRIDQRSNNITTMKAKPKDLLTTSVISAEIHHDFHSQSSGHIPHLTTEYKQDRPGPNPHAILRGTRDPRGRTHIPGRNRRQAQDQDSTPPRGTHLMNALERQSNDNGMVNRSQKLPGSTHLTTTMEGQSHNSETDRRIEGLIEQQSQYQARRSTRFFTSGTQCQGADPSIMDKSNSDRDIASYAGTSVASYDRESSTRYFLPTPSNSGNKTSGLKGSHKPLVANSEDEIGPDDSISRVSSRTSHMTLTSRSNAPSIDQSIAELTSLVQSAFDRIDQLEVRKRDTNRQVKLSVDNKTMVSENSPEREPLPKGEPHRHQSCYPNRSKPTGTTIDRRVTHQTKHHAIPTKDGKGQHQPRHRCSSNSKNRSESRSPTPIRKPTVTKAGTNDKAEKQKGDKVHKRRRGKTAHPNPYRAKYMSSDSDEDEVSARKQNENTTPSDKSGRKHSTSRTHNNGKDLSENYDHVKNKRLSSKSHGRREYSPDSSNDEMGPIHARKLVPAKFNGTTSVDSFFAQFESCALYNRWGERDKVAHLRWCLIDSAANILWDRGENTQSLTYKELSQKVRQRWGSEGQEERYQSELRSRRRKRGETLQNLYQEIRRLMSLAYPGELSKFSESIAKDAFLSALDDVRLELRCREQEPKDLDAALRTALRFEQYEKAVNGSLLPSHTNRQLHATADTGLRKEINELKWDLEKMKRATIEKEKAEGRANAIATGRQMNSGQSWDNAKPKDSNSNRMIGIGGYQRGGGNWENSNNSPYTGTNGPNSSGGYQWNTRTTYHESNTPRGGGNITDRGRGSYLTNRSPEEMARQERARNEGLCFLCNCPGHYRYNCPKLERDPRPANGSRSLYNRGSAPHTSSHPYTPSRRDQPQVIPNSATSVQNPTPTSPTANQSNWQGNTAMTRGLSTAADKGYVYIRAEIQELECVCLLDSGSEVTVFPDRVVPKHLLRPTSQRLHAANGTILELIGEVELTCYFGELELLVHGVVSPRIYEVMFGQDFLTRQKVHWDFEQSTIGMHGHEFPLLAGEHRGWCRRVVLEQSKEIPAWSETVIEGGQQYRNTKSCDGADSGLWTTDNCVVQRELQVARTLVNGDRDRVPVRVINMSQHPITLSKGTVLSDLEEAVGVIEQISQPSDPSMGESPTVQTNNTEGAHVQPILDGIDVNVSNEDRQKLKTLLRDYTDIFSQSEYDLGRTNLSEHIIDTGDNKPVREALRRQPPLYQKVIREQTDEMLTAGIITPACSEWSSNVVLVKKQDGSFRFCVDYRRVNDVTKKDSFPLPRIDQCLDALAGSKWFSSFDLVQGFFQIGMEPSSSDKTTFITRDGSFKFCVMPFGLTNSPSTFQRLMNNVLRGLNFNICLAYLDDIIIYSSTVSDSLVRLQLLFERIRDAGLKFKFSKCHLLKRSLKFLGHIVSEEGIATNPEKVSAVRDWVVPESVHEVRSFLGLCSYYRKFIEGFANIAAPLHQLTSVSSKFKWDSQCQQAFDTLKERLTNTPILALPTDEDPYVLDTDASGYAIGAVLSQLIDGKERVIAYASRTYNRAEQNYCTTRKELLAVVYFIGYFRQYLLGRHFRLRTDHAALLWLRRTPNLVGQEARWLEKLEEYEYTMEHRSGRAHINADCLSRPICRKTCCRPPTEEDVTTNRRLTTKETDAIWPTERIIDAQCADTDLKPLYRALLVETRPEKETIAIESAETKAYWYQWPVLALRDGLMCRRFQDALGRIRWQLIVPREYRGVLIRLLHGSEACQHLGLRKTIASILQVAYWCGYRDDIKNELQNCIPCSQYFRGKPPKQVGLHTYFAGEPWERISFDITGRHPKSRKGNSYIFTIIDHWTKYAFAFPVRNHTATTLVNILVNKVYPTFGFPHQTLCDNATEHNSNIMRELERLGEIEGLRSIPYRPQSNAVCERFHLTLNRLIAKAVDDAHRNWDELLPHLMRAYNTTVHDSTSFTPHFLMFGREMRTPIDIVLASKDDPSQWENYEEFVEHQRQLMRQAFQLVREHTKQCAERRKDRYALNVREMKFHEGDWVWRYYPRNRPNLSPKWQKMYQGPFHIIKVVSPTCVTVQLKTGAKPINLHIDQLKLFKGELPPKATLKSGVNTQYPDKESQSDQSEDETSEMKIRKGTRHRRAPERWGH